MIIYADIIFFNNTLMTYALIWSVGYILRYDIEWWRLLIAAVTGTIYTFIIIFLKPGNWSFLWHIILNIITALLMIRIAFGNLSRKNFIRAVGYLYLISFLTIGTILSLVYIFGLTPFKNTGNIFLMATGLIIIVLISKQGWHIFNKYVTPDVFYVPSIICINDRQVRLNALIDTGNSLTDPLTHEPVIVTEFKSLLPLFPDDLRKKLTEKGGMMGLIEILNENGWGNRVRVLPFSDLGQEHGMLTGIRPDRVKFLYKETTFETKKVLIAITDKKLDDEGKYQALINPHLIQEID